MDWLTQVLTHGKKLEALDKKRTLEITRKESTGSSLANFQYVTQYGNTDCGDFKGGIQNQKGF